MFDLEAHLTRQMVFSRATFGPGMRTAGVIDHIRKELVEVESLNDSEKTPEEWVDVVILAMDGLTRSLWAGTRCNGRAEAYSLNADQIARVAVMLILAKQGKNERRNWPDWRTAAPGKAIEHVRGTLD